MASRRREARTPMGGALVGGGGRGRRAAAAALVLEEDLWNRVQFGADLVGPAAIIHLVQNFRPFARSPSSAHIWAQ